VAPHRTPGQAESCLDYAAGTASPHWFVSGDLNGDGGGGGFGSGTAYVVGTQPQLEAVADPNQISATLSVLLGDGVGGLGLPTDYPIGSIAGGMAIQDLFSQCRRITVYFSDAAPAKRRG
jgi:hypothetical protein